MNAPRFALATIIGAVVLHVVGYLIFTTAFADFYAAQSGSATGVMREGEVFWAVALGNLSYAALITYVMSRRPDAPSLADGALIGAVVGFLLWFTADFVLFGITNIATLTRTVVDPLLEVVHGGVAGVAIAAVARSQAGSAQQAV
jgi:hypothetical protein